MVRFAISITLLLASSVAVAQDRYSYLVGGGEKNEEAMKLALSHAKRDANGVLWVVYIGYASSVPKTALEQYRDLLRKVSASPWRILTLNAAPATNQEAAEHAKILKKGGLIVESGGSQNRYMKPFFDYAAIAKAYDESYQSGVPDYVTSATTAKQPHRMFTGDVIVGTDGKNHYELQPGAGRLGDIVVDTHFQVYKASGVDPTPPLPDPFYQNHRELRMVDVMAYYNIEHGLGIDEDATLEIKNEEIATVVSQRKAFVYEKRADGIFRFEMRRGDIFNLKSWKAISLAPGAVCERAFSTELIR